MTNEKLMEEFEALFRELHKDDEPGHSGMLLNIGADDEYLFHRTRTLFSFYRAGVASQQEKVERLERFAKSFLKDFEGDFVSFNVPGLILDTPPWSPLTRLYEEAKAALSTLGVKEKTV